MARKASAGGGASAATRDLQKHLAYFALIIATLKGTQMLLQYHAERKHA